LLNQRAGLLAGFLDEMIRSPDAERIDRSLSWAEFGRHLTEPYRVVLLGKPNVGKSSLINALAGYRRAIVSPVAGTTRDALSASSTFEGVPIDWIDGAGVRSTGDSLEAAGVAKIVAEAQRADLIVDVVDLSDPAGSTIELGELISIRTGESQTRDDRESVPSRPGSPIRMLVGNKRDLVVAVPDEIDGRRMELALSAFEVESVARLGEAVANRLTRRRPEPDEPIPLIARHVSLLRELRGRV
jgi:tRNA modification GTPase